MPPYGNGHHAYQSQTQQNIFYGKKATKHHEIW